MRVVGGRRRHLHENHLEKNHLNGKGSRKRPDLELSTRSIARKTPLDNCLKREPHANLSFKEDQLISLLRSRL